MITFSLKSWLKNWEHAIKNSDDSLFFLTIENISEYLVDSIDAHPRKNPFGKESYELKLLFYLDELMSGTGLEANLVKKHRLGTINSLHNDVTRIQSQLSSGQRLTIDAKLIRRNLNRVNQFYGSRKLLKEIENIMIKYVKKSSDSPHLQVATSILLRILITKYSPKYLSEFPGKVFAEHFFSSKKSLVISTIKKDKQLMKEFDKFVTQIVKHGSTKARKLSDPRKSAKLVNFIVERDMMMYGNFPWMVKNVRNFLQDIRQFNEILTTKSQTHNLRILRETLKEPSIKKLIDKLTRDYMTDVISPVIYQCVGHLDPLKADSKLKNHKFGVRYSEIAKRAWYGENSQPYANFIYPILETSFISVRKSYTAKICRQFLRKYGTLEKKKLVLMIKGLIEKEITNPSKHYFQNKKIIDRIVDSFELDKSLNKLIRETLTQNISNILKMIEQANPSLVLREKKRILGYHSDLFLRDMKRSSYYNDQIPHDLAPARAIMLLKKFFKELSSEKKKFRVFCLIGGLDCKDRAFSVGNVVFYDARKWEFGEGNYLDRYYDAPLTTNQKFTSNYEIYEKIEMGDGKFVESKRNSGRAFVDVIATDQKKAIEKATASIRESLTTLVYASSAHASHGGFQPTLPSHYAILQKEGRSGTMGRDGPTPRTLEIDETYDKIIAFYNQLITKKKTRFDESILKSFMWFQKGKWETIPYEKFLSYWIALEQLILTHTENSTNNKGHKIRLLKFVPRLSVSWRKSNSAFVIGNYLRSIAPMIRSGSRVGRYLQSSSDRRRWEENYAILLEHLPKLTLLSKRIELRNSLKGLQEFVKKNNRHIRSECNWRLQIQKFKVARLYEKRNLIVHEGAIGDDEIPLMTAALEKVLIDVLRPFLEFREGRTLNQIAVENQRPYRLRETTL